MNVCGVDPGEPTGWCILQIGDEPSYVAHGLWAPSDGLAAWYNKHVDVWGIEKPDGFYPSREMLGHGGATLARIAAGLLVAADVGGELRGRVLESRGMAIPINAADARRWLGVKIGGRGAATRANVDQQIAEIIPLAIRGWPKRSNVQTRDAGVCALYAHHLVRMGQT